MSKNLILLHGFCESKDMWVDFEHKLSKQFNVFCLDLPGFGDFHFDISGMEIDEIAQVVQKEINDLSLDDYVIVGHSLGGYVALSLIRQFPAKIKGLGLFHSTAYPDSKERVQKRNDVIKFIDKHGAGVFAKSFIPQLFSTSYRESNREDIDKLIQIASNCSSTSLMEITKAMQTRKDNTKLLSATEVPILFIAGKQDISVPLKDSVEQIQLPKDSIVQILEDCGHMGMFEQKEKTIIQVGYFVEYCYK